MLKEIIKEIKKKFWHIIDGIDKERLQKEIIILGIAIGLYLIGKYLDIFECIIIYLLTIIWLRDEI